MYTVYNRESMIQIASTLASGLTGRFFAGRIDPHSGSYSNVDQEFHCEPIFYILLCCF